MSRLVRIGEIGAGFMGRAHSECILASGKGELEIVYSRSKEKASSVADKYGYKKWTVDWRKVINDPDVDLVDITSPNYMHKDMCVATAEAGKDFIIEKPLARNVKEAEEIISAVKKAGVRAYYAEDLRYAPDMVEAKKIIDLGGIGSPFMIRTNEMHNGPFHSKWFWNGELAGGGVLIDVGIHGLYLIEWLLSSEAVEVFAKSGTMKWKELCKNNAEDSAWCIWTFKNGTVAETVFSWAIAGGMDSRVEIFGLEGSIYIDSARNASGIEVFSEKGYGESLEVQKSERPHVSSVQGWHRPSVDMWNVHGHAQEMRHFLDCWLEKKDSITTIEDGKRALMLVEAAYRSARSGNVEKV